MNNNFCEHVFMVVNIVLFLTTDSGKWQCNRVLLSPYSLICTFAWINIMCLVQDCSCY